jgi:peptide-methionine (S)-S-oxide reductase
MALLIKPIRKVFLQPCPQLVLQSFTTQILQPINQGITKLRTLLQLRVLPGAWRGTLLALLLQAPLSAGIQSGQAQPQAHRPANVHATGHATAQLNGLPIRHPSSQTSGQARGQATAVLAGGCFWGMEAVFEHVRGVTAVVSGYAGGSSSNPSYEQVSSGQSGHAEAVRITFDPKRITYDQLLAVFLTVAHNPTELNRQGPDVGSQYRSGIFYTDANQKRAATRALAQLQRSHTYHRPAVTQVLPLRSFHPAEAYHQNFLARHPTNPYIVVHDLPKLLRLRKRFAGLYQPLFHVVEPGA